MGNPDLRSAGLPLRTLLSLGLVWVASTARADHDPDLRGFDAVPIKATPALESGIALEGARFYDPGSMRAAFLLDANFGVLALKLGNEKLGDLIPFRADAHLMFGYQLHRRVEVAVDLPLTVYQTNNFRLLDEQGFTTEGISAVGLGDFRVLPRVSILHPNQFPLGLAGVVEVRLPLGDARSFLGDVGVVFAPRLSAELPLGPLRVLANLGYRLRPHHAQFLNLYVGQEFYSGVGAQLTLPDAGAIREPTLMAEMHLATPTEAPFTFAQADSLKTPWELLVGARARLYQNWAGQVVVGRGLGLEAGYGREAFRFMLGVEYARRVLDRDGDGIPDDVDGCPDVPEDHDGYQDSDGCPEPDNDNDGVLDKDDGCPMDPGPREYDGCPDRDGDQVPDNVDKCPDVPGIPDLDGCPDPAGPKVELESDRLRVRGNILFETGEATIQQQSYPMLDEVYKVLAQNPDLGPVLIEGHTDNRGGRAYNQDLSDRRARAVAEYLVRKGIARSRLRAKGYGFDRPVADNSTPLGRAKNRRTEFTLLTEDKPPEKAVPEGARTLPPEGGDSAATAPAQAPATPDAGAPAAASASGGPDAGVPSASPAPARPAAPAKRKGAGR